MNPPVPLTTVPDSASRSTNQNTAAVSTDQSKPSKSHRSDSDDNQSETVISRLHLSDKQKCVRDDFEAKRRKEARDDALKEKQRRKRVCTVFAPILFLPHLPLWAGEFKTAWVNFNVSNYISIKLTYCIWVNSTWVETIWKCIRAKFTLTENNPVYHITLEVYKKSVCNAFSMAVYRTVINWKGSTPVL